VELEAGGRVGAGVAAGGLPPKWLTKAPAAPFEEEVRARLEVITQGCVLGRGLPAAPTVFDLWHRLYLCQMQWAAPRGHPPLRWNFGVSLVERAVLDAFCGLPGATFADAVRRNTLGIRLGALCNELAGLSPADLLPHAPHPLGHVEGPVQTGGVDHQVPGLTPGEPLGKPRRRRRPFSAIQLSL
jgi:hypothetical protein